MRRRHLAPSKVKVFKKKTAKVIYSVCGNYMCKTVKITVCSKEDSVTKQLN